MRLSTQILLGFTVVLVLSIIDTYSNYVLSVKVEKNGTFLNNSQEVIRNSNQLHKSIIEMQNSFRGYLLTDDTAFLQNYRAGSILVPVFLAEQKKRVARSSRQNELLDSIELLHGQWVEYAGSLIDARKNIAVSSQNYSFLFDTKLKKYVGEAIHNKIAEKFVEFDKLEYAIRQVHSTNLMSSIAYAHAYSFTFFGLTIVFGIAVTVYIISLITRRIKTMVSLAENISNGRFEIIEDYKNDEMTPLSHSLNIMSRKLKANIAELQRRNEELNRFAYVVSHDLKAPLRGIYNVIQWIEEDLANEISAQMKKYLSYIPERTRRMEELINAILEYTRVREKTRIDMVDTEAMVNEIADSIVPRSFSVTIHNLPRFYAEEIKLKQVFMNLISNAVKYTPPVNGKIIVGCTEFDDYYKFSVKDNGIGIDEEYHKKIFEMFQTLRDKNDKESTGLGLTIIKRIIEEQNGIILVNSKAGEGAEFIFTWPKVAAQERVSVEDLKEVSGVN
jgi:signal transduction histidine kinase